MGEVTVQIGLPRASMRPRQGAIDATKNCPSGKASTPAAVVGGAIGHAAFVAQPAPIPREKETSPLSVDHAAGGEQGLAIAGPRNAVNPTVECTDVRRAVSTHALEGGSIQNIDRRAQ